MKVLCVDLRSFYASVECVLRGLDPYTTKLVVADISRGSGSVVLAVTPYLRSLGFKSRSRVFELPKDDEIIFAKPRMKKYIEFSTKVYEVYLKYVSKEDIHIYSIDEAFLDITSYLNYYKQLPIDIAQQIIDDILTSTGISAACGVGDNMFLAKVALDCLAKKTKTGVAYLDKETFKKELWDLRPITNIWGIGVGIEKRLSAMGIYTLRHIAETELELLEKEFGVIGRELYLHAHGIDESKVSEIRDYIPEHTSIGYGQVLFKDYTPKELEVIILEMTDEIATQLVMQKFMTQLVHISITYSKHVGGGFSRQRSLAVPTNSRKILLHEIMTLFYKFVEDLPIRKVQIRVGKLSNEEFVQTSLFENDKTLTKERMLYEAIGNLKNRYGKNAINLAASLTKGATKIQRNKLIGGHNAE